MSARILIIEDNAINRELLDYLLRSFGYQTLSAAHGGIGFDMAIRERPDLILCDIQMPGMDGYEFARQAKSDERLRHIPLIAVTAYAMVGDADRILEFGFDGYVSKPIDPLALIELVKSFIASSGSPATPSSDPVIGVPHVLDEPATILIVDDTPFNLDLERDLLIPHGYEVLTADTIADALQLARAHRPALIVSDVGMRCGSGFDLIRAVKADEGLRDIPFVFISSTHQDDASRAGGLRLGAVRFLLRPMDPDLLLAELRACMKPDRA